MRRIVYLFRSVHVAHVSSDACKNGDWRSEILYLPIPKCRRRAAKQIECWPTILRRAFSSQESHLHLLSGISDLFLRNVKTTRVHLFPKLDITERVDVNVR